MHQQVGRIDGCGYLGPWQMARRKERRQALAHRPHLAQRVVDRPRTEQEWQGAEEKADQRKPVAEPGLGCNNQCIHERKKSGLNGYCGQFNTLRRGCPRRKVLLFPIPLIAPLLFASEIISLAMLDLLGVTIIHRGIVGDYEQGIREPAQIWFVRFLVFDAQYPAPKRFQG